MSIITPKDVEQKDYTEKEVDFVPVSDLEIEKKAIKIADSYENFVKKKGPPLPSNSMSEDRRLKNIEKELSKYVKGVSVKVYEVPDFKVAVNVWADMGLSTFLTYLHEALDFVPILVRLDGCVFHFKLDTSRKIVFYATVTSEALKQLKQKEIIAAIIRPLVYFAVSYEFRNKIRLERANYTMFGFSYAIGKYVMGIIAIIGFMSTTIIGIAVGILAFYLAFRIFRRARIMTPYRRMHYVADMLMKKNKCLFETYKSYLKKTYLTMYGFKKGSKHLLEEIGEESIETLRNVIKRSRRTVFQPDVHPGASYSALIKDWELLWEISIMERVKRLTSIIAAFKNDIEKKYVKLGFLAKHYLKDPSRFYDEDSVKRIIK